MTSANDPPTPPKLGRPAIVRGEPSTRLAFRLSTAAADELYRRAQREQISVSELLRRAARSRET